MVHRPLRFPVQSNRLIRYQAHHYAWDSPGRMRVTRDELVSRGERVAKDELKEGLFGSDKTSLERLTLIVCFGVMSVSETRSVKSEKKFLAVRVSRV